MPIILRHNKPNEVLLPSEVWQIRGKLIELVTDVVYCYATEIDYFDGHREHRWIKNQLDMWSKRRHKTEEEKEEEALRKRTKPPKAKAKVKAKQKKRRTKL